MYFCSTGRCDRGAWNTPVRIEVKEASLQWKAVRRLWGDHFSYFQSNVPLSLWSWQRLAGCCFAAPTGRTLGPDWDLEEVADHRSCWPVRQASGGFCPYLQTRSNRSCKKTKQTKEQKDSWWVADVLHNNDQSFCSSANSHEEQSNMCDTTFFSRYFVVYVSTLYLKWCKLSFTVRFKMNRPLDD